MKKVLTIIVLLSTLSSCISDNPLIDSKFDDSQEIASHKIRLEDALLRAEYVMRDITDGGITRGGEKQIESISFVRNELKMRSGGVEMPDTLLYIVNYEDNGGFAILSADNRTTPIYAISQEGHFEMSDTVENKALALFVNNMNEDYENSIVGGLQPDTSYINNRPALERKYRQIKPLIAPGPRSWHQYAPFNTYCVTSEGVPALAGCTAVATGVVMSYYKYPEVYGTHTYNWENMLSDINCDDIAVLIHDLGLPGNLSIIYGKSYSGALFANVEPTFVNFGYNDPGDYASLTPEMLRQFLSLGPVLTWGNYNGGHSWVIDGYIQYVSDTIQDADEPSYDSPLFHCIWGYTNSPNGYFYWSDGAICEADPVEFDEDDLGVSNYSNTWKNLNFLYNFSKAQ